MTECPCGSGQPYADCCAPLINGEAQAQSAEALMRARYSAHVNSEIDYIHDTTLASRRDNFNRARLLNWTQHAQWLGLEILDTTDGMPEDTTGTVEFIARYREKGKRVNHHEIAEFTKEDGRWFFKDGNAPKAEQFIRQGPKVGRNDPCPCGSGKKYKKCCGL
jgi:SEC-C motif-containing protein